VDKKTQLSDLIGEDGQKIAYLINEHKYLVPFKLSMEDGIWEDSLYTIDELTHEFRWSNSPFTKYEDAKPFIF